MHKYLAVVKDTRGTFNVQYRARTVQKAWAWFKAQFHQDGVKVVTVRRVR